MNDKTNEDRLAVYEIGYLVVRSVPEDKVAEEADKIKAIITKAGATIIADETPHLENLAYTMRVKTVSGSYEKSEQAYFGWVKFEVSSGAIEAIKSSVESMATVLRMIVLKTVKENTYMGKRASAIAAAIAPKRTAEAEIAPIEKKEQAPVSIEDMDKSIDEMVKEVK